ncbi:hypothetical protein F383_17262 [Gossypium arboreum]|uniref:Uncharacterized protein n=1 Tax=Gossypium arboreum TaxID=29729 RepID=A0A0B0NLK3_GOSAR|nr:hypothetical protein F383_17262 [Gossypium arboreum]
MVLPEIISRCQRPKRGLTRKHISNPMSHIHLPSHSFHFNSI